MSSPTAESLFLQLWCTASSSDDAPTPMPGTPAFRVQRSQTFGYWARCWVDCQTLAAHLASVTKMQQEIAESFKVPEGEAAAVEVVE